MQQRLKEVLYSVCLFIRSGRKAAQEIRPFTKINNSFKKIVITSNTPKPFYNDDGILMMSVLTFYSSKSHWNFNP